MARRNNTYVYGNTARALRPIEQEVRSPRKLSAKSRRNIDRDTGMNPGFMLFMTLAMVLTGIVCVQYIRLQSSQIRSRTIRTAVLEQDAALR